MNTTVVLLGPIHSEKVRGLGLNSIQPPRKKTKPDFFFLGVFFFLSNWRAKLLLAMISVCRIKVVFKFGKKKKKGK